MGNETNTVAVDPALAAAAVNKWIAAEGSFSGKYGPAMDRVRELHAQTPWGNDGPGNDFNSHYHGKTFPDDPNVTSAVKALKDFGPNVRSAIGTQVGADVLQKDEVDKVFGEVESARNGGSAGAGSGASGPASAGGSSSGASSSPGGGASGGLAAGGALSGDSGAAGSALGGLSATAGGTGPARGSAFGASGTLASTSAANGRSLLGELRSLPNAEALFGNAVLDQAFGPSAAAGGLNAFASTPSTDGSSKALFASTTSMIGQLESLVAEGKMTVSDLQGQISGQAASGPSSAGTPSSADPGSGAHSVADSDGTRRHPDTPASSNPSGQGGASSSGSAGLGGGTPATSPHGGSGAGNPGGTPAGSAGGGLSPSAPGGSGPSGPGGPDAPGSPGNASSSGTPSGGGPGGGGSPLGGGPGGGGTPLGSAPGGGGTPLGGAPGGGGTPLGGAPGGGPSGGSAPGAGGAPGGGAPGGGGTPGGGGSGRVGAPASRSNARKDTQRQRPADEAAPSEHQSGDPVDPRATGSPALSASRGRANENDEQSDRQPDAQEPSITDIDQQLTMLELRMAGRQGASHAPAEDQTDNEKDAAQPSTPSEAEDSAPLSAADQEAPKLTEPPRRDDVTKTAQPPGAAPQL